MCWGLLSQLVKYLTPNMNSCALFGKNKVVETHPIPILNQPNVLHEKVIYLARKCEEGVNCVLVVNINSKIHILEAITYAYNTLRTDVSRHGGKFFDRLIFSHFGPDMI